MPVTLVDRLPLPNIKVYTAGSVLLLSVAVFHALSVTSDPEWKVPQRQQVLPAEGDPDVPKMVQVVQPPDLNMTNNLNRNFTEQLTDVMTFMLQEPLCMWTVINISYCVVALGGVCVQRAVFGPLRVAEAQRVRDKLWNFVFYKFIFVFGVANVQYMDEVLLWCAWFSCLGSLHLLTQLCKDRFDYVSSSPNACSWARARLVVVLGVVQAACGGLLVLAARYGLPAGRDTFAFMAAECVLVLVRAGHVTARAALQAARADAAGPLAYYTHLAFDSVALVAELAHVVHMVVYSNMVVSMASLVLLMQLRHLLHALQARLRRHRLYTSLATHMSKHYPMASKEEVEKNQDNCAICWEPMKEARKLPCSHLFHNSCLCQWVQQDASCPTCRRPLGAGGVSSAGAGRGAGRGAGAGEAAPPLRLLDEVQAPPLAQPNRLFRFDGSRYVSWLPSFSVEVTRVRVEPLPAAQLDAMIRQVQAVFPQYPARLLVGELTATRSAAVTVDNILEGRLAPPPTIVPEPAVIPAAPAPAPVQVPVTLDEPDNDETVTGEFSEEAEERESLLQRRKKQLLAAARRKYLQRSINSQTAHS